MESAEEKLPAAIETFLNGNKVASICFVTDKNVPYCITCFYYFDKSSLSLIFKSSKGTTHDAFIKKGTIISGTILPDKVDLINLKGTQFSAVLMSENEINEHGLKAKYTKKYIISSAMPGYIWAARLTFVKHTDNSLGFGSKTIWQSGKSLNESV